MEEITKSAIKHIVEQPEYQRKQAISILIASMLNDISNKPVSYTHLTLPTILLV